MTLADSRVQQDEPVEVFLGSPASTAPDVLEPEVFTNESRPMVGQSDFLANASLYYTNPAAGTTATLLYSAVGDRLSQVGTQGYDDIYELARHTFDVTVEQPVASGVAAKLTFQNLTDEPYRFRLGDDTTREYKAGQQYAVTLSYAF